MTEQVRKGYRSHRKATWGVVAAFVVVLAAAVTPFATGAPPKEYSLKASPTPICFTGSGQVQAFELTLKNERGNTTLGSAEITAPEFIKPQTLDVAPAGSELDGQVIKLRNLGLTPGTEKKVTVSAEILSTGTGSWTSVAKQSNNFADAPGPGNLFSLKDSESELTLEVSECAPEYVFVEGPVNAEKGAAQPVKVQIQADGVAVPVSGSLTLSAFQNESTSVDSSFSGLTATAPDASGTYAGKQWTFSVTGGVSGTGYALKAGNTISDPTFSIVDGLCDPNVTDTEHLKSSCSLTSDFGDRFEAGVTINNHKLPPIAITFAPGNVATGKCSPWKRATYKIGSEEYIFPGVELDFSWGSGMLRVVYRLRNSDWVLTDASRGNSDIEICAGARHGENLEQNGDGASSKPFKGKYGEAIWNAQDGLFWGVLASVPNPGKVKDDPVVCSSGNQSLPTGPNGASETWRAWTICIPYDWDWKNFG